ncbi:MAG: hypothetical protein K2Q22_12260, partial [Cytophagales bacterium]|nr:hypothetical protein [Cytophagales bacterium]
MSRISPSKNTFSNPSNVILALNFILLMVFLLLVDLNPQRMVELVGELWSDEKWMELSEFLVVYVLAAGSLFVAFWLRNPVFRYIILLGWLPLIWTNMNFRLITGYEFMYSDA